MISEWPHQICGRKSSLAQGTAAWGTSKYWFQSVQSSNSAKLRSPYDTIFTVYKQRWWWVLISTLSGRLKNASITFPHEHTRAHTHSKSTFADICTIFNLGSTFFQEWLYDLNANFANCNSFSVTVLNLLFLHFIVLCVCLHVYVWMCICWIVYSLHTPIQMLLGFVDVKKMTPRDINSQLFPVENV